MLFVEPSAILAILLNEPEAELFFLKITHSEELYCSAIGKFEVVAGLCRIKAGLGKPVSRQKSDEAIKIVDDFFDSLNIALLPLDENVAMNAISAYQVYGKGTGHKANLNMGDCFSYACCKVLDAALLFKGNDFIHTDVKCA
ncbi:type II toxin-antitoxin system VapC family toxin [Bartonella sp. B17]